MFSLLFGDFTWGWYHDWSLPQFLNLSVTSNYIFVDIMIGRLSNDPQFSISLLSLIISLCFLFREFSFMIICFGMPCLCLICSPKFIWTCLRYLFDLQFQVHLYVSYICLICNSKFTQRMYHCLWLLCNCVAWFTIFYMLTSPPYSLLICRCVHSPLKWYLYTNHVPFPHLVRIRITHMVVTVCVVYASFYLPSVMLRVPIYWVCPRLTCPWHWYGE